MLFRKSKYRSLRRLETFIRVWLGLLFCPCEYRFDLKPWGWAVPYLILVLLAQCRYSGVFIGFLPPEKWGMPFPYIFNGKIDPLGIAADITIYLCGFALLLFASGMIFLGRFQPHPEVRYTWKSRLFIIFSQVSICLLVENSRTLISAIFCFQLPLILTLISLTKVMDKKNLLGLNKVTKDSESEEQYVSSQSGRYVGSEAGDSSDPYQPPRTM